MIRLFEKFPVWNSHLARNYTIIPQILLRLTLSQLNSNYQHGQFQNFSSKRIGNFNDKDSMDAYQLSERITNLANTHRLEEAIELVEKTPVRNLSTVVYNHLIEELIKLNRIRSAYKIYNKMKKRGFKPNPQSYTILLKGCTNNPGVNSDRLAEKLIESAKKINQPAVSSNENSDIVSLVKDDTPGVNIIHYNNLLNLHSKRNQLPEMIELYDQLREQQPLLYQCYGYGSKLSIDEFEEPLDPKKLAVPDVFSYTTVINGLSTIPSSDEAFEQVASIWLDYKEDLDNFISFEQFIHKNRRNLKTKSNPLRNRRSKYSLDDVIPSTPKIDYREVTQRNMRFDSGFLLALMKSCKKCSSEEYLYKGLELVDSAFDLNLNLNYPTTEKYLALPKLDIELKKRPSLRLNPSILQISLEIMDKLKLDEGKVQLFVKCCDEKSLKMRPDLYNFYNMFSSLAHQVTDLVKTHSK